MAYTDSYENDNTFSSAKQISVGSTQTHSLTAGDVDWVKFYVSTSGIYSLETTGGGDTKLYLYDSSGTTQLAYNDDIDYSAGNYSSRVTQTLSTGWYYAKVTGFSSTTTIDSYGIRLTQTSSSVPADSYENDNSRFKAKTITVGSTQNRTIHSSTDEDWIKFTVASDGFYSIVTGGMDTILQLYSFENQAFGYNDDRGNGNLGSFGVVQLYANTTYYARVTAYNGKTGSYTFSVTSGVVADTFESNSDGTRLGTTTTISPGSTQIHTIHNSSDIDWIKVNISTEGLYLFTLGTSERDDGQMSLQLYNSSGSRLTNANCQKESGENPYIGGRLTEGTYYIRAAAANTGSVAGEYSVNVSKVSSLGYASADQYEDDAWYEDAATISVGTTQTRSLNVYGSNTGTYNADVDYIKFTPTVTGTYKVAVSGTTAPTHMTIYVADEYGIPLIPVGGSSKINPSVENYMQAGQTYYIKMESDYEHLNVDSYQIGVTLSSTYTAEADTYESDKTTSTAKTISVGTSQAHSLHTTSDVDIVKFTPTTSGYYTFYTGARNGNAGDGDLMIGIYDSAGTLLIYDDDSFAGYNAMVSYNMTAGQTYYALVTSARNNQVVPYYTLSLTSGVLEDTYDIDMDERSIQDNTLENAILLELNKPQAHSIHTSIDVDWVGFVVEESGYYTLQTGGTGDTIISVYDEDGNFLLLNDDGGIGRNASVTRHFMANTIYYAKVSSYQNSLIPNYSLSLTKASGGNGDAYENDNTKATAKGIVAGETQSRSIHVAGDVDWVKIRPLQAGTYQIQTSGEGDLKLDLYSSNGTTLLASDDDSGVGLNARIGYVLDANTDYYIKAYTYDGDGIVDNYGLSVALMVGSELGDEYENDNSPTTAKAITLGATQSHSIHIEGDVDWVTFTPTVSAEYTIQTVGSGLNCDTQLYLYTSLANAQSGSSLQWDDDSGADRNALISRVLTAGTTYYIKAQAWSTYTIPSYGLKVTQNNGYGANSGVNEDEYESDDLSGLCKPIAVGRVYTHNIDVQSDTDWVRFYTHQTGTYTIQTTGESDMSFIFYRRIPGGALVPDREGREISTGGTGGNALYRAELQSNNWYYVRMTTKNRATTSASYGIRVDIDSASVNGDRFEKEGGKVNDNGPSRASWVTPGTVDVHSIHTPGDQDWMAYKSANATSVVFSASNEENKEMRLFVYKLNASGALDFISQSTYGSYGFTSVMLETDANSTYYVRAQALNSTETVSSYQFEVGYRKDSYEDDDTSAKATDLIVNGAYQTHNIHSQNDVDWFKVNITSSGMYEFETTGDGDTYGILYRSRNGTNSKVTESDGGGVDQNMKISTSLSTGTYYLRVSGNQGKVVESYTVTARTVITQYDEPNNSKSSATALIVGSPKTGSFHTTSDVDYFKVTNGAAGKYTFTANSSAVKIELFSGNSSTVVASGMGSVSYTTSSTGTLYAKLTNANGDLMSSYTVSATYTQPTTVNKAENYVVLFSGGGNVSGNWNTFIQNFNFIYTFLRENYDIPADHIYVLYADGLDRGIDMTHVSTGREFNTDVESFCPGAQIFSATERNLRNVMRSVAGKADGNDHVLVYTFDHGTHAGASSSSTLGGEYIVPWNPTSTSDYISGVEFADMAADIDAGYQTYLFAQCYSGGILDAMNLNRSGIKMYGAVASDHRHTASAGITEDSDGVDVYGFNYQVARAFYNEITTTNQMTAYVQTNPFRDMDGGFERGSNFQIFAQS